MAVNIGSIKTNFKSILDSANTTTAQYDLSAGMSQRVAKVLKVNPSKIPIQTTFFPYVTIYTTDKEIELATIAKDQITAKRFSEITFSVVAAVWEQLVSDVTADSADNEVEILMENIEEVVRRNFKLNDTCKWTVPKTVSYHTLRLDEAAHMRVGVMELMAKVEY